MDREVNNSNGKVGAVKKILFVCGIVLLCISAVQLLLGGAGDVSWFKGVVLPLILIAGCRPGKSNKT